MKIEVARSFSRTHQIKDFHPVVAFASYKAEAEEKDIEKISEDLYQRAKADVMKALEEFIPKEDPINSLASKLSPDKLLELAKIGGIKCLDCGETPVVKKDETGFYCQGKYKGGGTGKHDTFITLKEYEDKLKKVKAF